MSVFRGSESRSLGKTYIIYVKALHHCTIRASRFRYMAFGQLGCGNELLPGIGQSALEDMHRHRTIIDSIHF